MWLKMNVNQAGTVFRSRWYLFLRYYAEMDDRASLASCKTPDDNLGRPKSCHNFVLSYSNFEVFFLLDTKQVTKSRRVFHYHQVFSFPIIQSSVHLA
jgi:hypothetical protein